jgi:two-component system chemotaxis sensor kinase CheA
LKVDISQFHDAFFEEAAEHLAVMEQLLVGLNIDNPDAESLNGIFRAAHSIKGGAGIFGFPDLAEFTHILESLLDKIRSGKLALQPAMIDIVLSARDLLEQMLERHRRGGEADAGELQTIAALSVQLDAFADSSYSATDNPIEDDGFGLFEESFAAPVADDDGFGLFEGNSAAVSADDDGFGFFDAIETPATDDGFGFFAEPAIAAPVQQAAAKPVPKSPSAESSSIRVSVEKADQLINMVGELVITQSMLAQLVAELDPTQFEKLHDAINQLARNTRDLQENAMSMRMLPIGNVFSRFPRVVRDTAAKLGKQVDLIIEGEGTELDKGLIEKLSDPLTHLVRNAIDHGIELPDVRINAGKAARGKIILKAFHQSGNIVIEITDDGHGLDRGRILAKARERGFKVSDEMPDADVWQLIFEPGFSTADAVTDISGRGVGMDVVRRNIHSMNGRIEIESHSGIGSRFTVWLPLTLAILDGMSIAVNGETYVLPLTNIIESVQPEPNSINTIAEHGRVIRVRGEYIPLSNLGTLLGESDRIADAEQCNIVVLLESEGRKFALQVDELVGESQVVIKSLENNYKRVPGFSGATILGNGRVAMILDVDALRRMSQHSR